jgi:hypothetical protein
MHYLGRIALSLCWGLWLPYLIPFTSQGQDESIALPPREEMAPIDSIEGIKQTEREERISFILLQLSLKNRKNLPSLGLKRGGLNAETRQLRIVTFSCNE